MNPIYKFYEGKKHQTLFFVPTQPNLVKTIAETLGFRLTIINEYKSAMWGEPQENGFYTGM